jgi:hypothetical protein
MVKTPAALVDAVRQELPLPDAKLEALRRFATNHIAGTPLDAAFAAQR